MYVEDVDDRLELVLMCIYSDSEYNYQSNFVCIYDICIIHVESLMMRNQIFIYLYKLLRLKCLLFTIKISYYITVFKTVTII